MHFPARPEGRFRVLLGLALVVQSRITYGLLRAALPSDPAGFRFRHAGMPLGAVVGADRDVCACMSALAQGVAGGALCMGRWMRASAWASLMLLANLLLLDQSLYQNHYWLLLHVLLCYAAVRDERMLCTLLRFATTLPYAFGALTKLSSDWILRNQPAALWCERGRFAQAVHPAAACAALLSIGGLLADAVIATCLALAGARVGGQWPRRLAVAVAVPFHLLNCHLFEIGIFPLLMLGALVLWADSAGSPARASGARPLRRSRAEAAFGAAFVLFHVTWPLRRFVIYPDASLWTQEGYYGAWQMKATQLDGFAIVEITPADDGSCTWASLPPSLLLAPQIDAELTPHQRVFVASRPHMMLQYVAHRAQQVSELTRCNVSVHAATSCFSLNGRSPQPLYRHDIDLLPIARAGTYDRLGASGAGTWLHALHHSDRATTRADGDCAALAMSGAREMRRRVRESAAALAALAAHGHVARNGGDASSDDTDGEACPDVADGPTADDDLSHEDALWWHTTIWKLQGRPKF